MFSIRHIAAWVMVMCVVVGLAASAQEPKPAQLSTNEAQAVEATCRAIAECFIKNDVDTFMQFCVPKSREDMVLIGGKCYVIQLD